MRIPGLRRDRGNEAIEQPPSQIICPVCGLRNDSMARFCRNCGLPLGAPRDPVRGTTSRRADLPSEHGTGIAAIVGLVVAVLVLGGAGWLILRSNSGGTAVLPASPTPAVTLAPGATARATIRPLLPSRVPASAGGSVAAATPGTRTPQPSDAPGASASAGPLVADTDFTCDLGSFEDPTEGSWRVSEARWGARAKWDELTIVLTREKGQGKTRFDVEAMSAQEAEQISGLEPARNDRVILITFDGDVMIRIPIVANMGLKALDFLNVETANDTTYAVVGVNTEGCYRLFAPAWTRGDRIAVGDTVNLLLDVKYR